MEERNAGLAVELKRLKSSLGKLSSSIQKLKEGLPLFFASYNLEDFGYF
jgi:hypothetical protein